jgi:hypothetical protein
MKRILPVFKISVLVIVSFLFLFFFSEVKAQEDGFRLRVSPPLLEIEIEPGGSYSDFIKFSSLSEFEQLTLYPQILSFKALGDEGGQEFIENAEENKTYSLAQWINISVDILEIDALDSVVLPFTISVPEDAEPGGRYAAILLSSQPDEDLQGSSAVALGAKSGTIILARVAGEATESAFISQFKTGREVYDYPPVDFEILVENRGNVHVKPVGRIDITDLFGNVVGELSVNETGGNVLPESTRKFTTEWEKEEFTIGKFTAVLTLNYGENSDNYVTETLTFWVIPTQELLIALAVLVVVITIIIVVAKSYKKSILKKASEIQNQNNSAPPPVQPTQNVDVNQQPQTPQAPPQNTSGF